MVTSASIIQLMSYDYQGSFNIMSFSGLVDGGVGSIILDLDRLVRNLELALLVAFDAKCFRCKVEYIRASLDSFVLYQLITDLAIQMCTFKLSILISSSI